MKNKEGEERNFIQQRAPECNECKDEKYRRWKCFHQHKFQFEISSRLLRDERIKRVDGFNLKIPAECFHVSLFKL